MPALLLHAEQWTAAPRGVTFGLFGAGAGAGWVFDAVCDRVETGSAVSLRAPLGGADVVEIIGRIGALRPEEYLEIVHDQPWRGRIKLRFRPDRGGTTVRLVAELDESGLEWLLRRRGFPAGRRESPNPRLGLLTSKSGPGNLFAAATDNLAALALEEVNAEGGIHGRPVELVVGDDATDPAVGVAEARRLVRAGCRTLLVATTSATFVAVSRALTGTDVLVVQTLMNEGGESGRLRLQYGERPEDQLATAAARMMRAAGGRRWFLAGNDYCWPRSTHAAARQVLPRFGARLVGERFAALGTQDFSPVIEAILASGAEIVLSTFVGADAAEFQRQGHRAGLGKRCLTLAPAMDESTLQRVGPDAARGLYAVSGYFEQLPTAGNDALLTRYRSEFGRWAPPLSTLTESVFEAVHMWWSVARRVGAEEPKLIADEMRRGRFELPRGTVTLSGGDSAVQPLHLFEAKGTAFALT
ncbi:substrate-binding protein [Amycolatopsis sp. GM8]|uniref:substrate-binding protein n=1 Tax=Amycolatopsis sp. GM8 TaxID=2896530 RepID=UPI001F3C956C|nr:substrate-binding protein [Amycolatopsis sp. GM8]